MAGGTALEADVKPVMAAAAASTEAREEELVAAARAGNPQAFEALFRRYRDRITTFVRSSVRDDGRSEDLVQEIFISAHRSLGSLSNPGAFRSWLYQIARNACLDEARRRSRQDELILGWDEFPPPDERIVIHNQSADGAASQREELTHLTQALDGLPDSQQEALVMREIGGLSYAEIGRRMRLSRPAVESVLFRARRGLKGEFSEISTGERCKRMQVVMGKVAEGAGDLGERRKLIRHMRDCAGCRRDAAALGLAGLAIPSDQRHGLQRALSRVAAFLPLPAFLRRAQDGELSAGAGSSSVAVQAQNAATQLSTAVTSVSSDHAASIIHKAAAVVAAVAVVGGGGVAIEKAGVKLPVEIPGIHAVKKNKSNSGPAVPAKQTLLGTPAAGGAHEPAAPEQKSGAASPGSTPSAPAAGETAPSTTGTTGIAPGATETPATGAPGTPAAGAPDTSSPGSSAPSDGGAKPDTGSSTGGNGDTTTGGSGSGGSTGSPSSGAGTGNSGGSGSSGGSGAEPAPSVIPEGLQNQLDSGKRTLQTLPPGIAKKLAKASAGSA